MPNPLVDFKDDHHVIMGLFLIMLGGFGAYASITGRLAPAIAGLFDTSDLVSASGGGTSLTTVEAALAGVNPTGQGGGAANVGGSVGGLYGVFQNFGSAIGNGLKGLLP